MHDRRTNRKGTKPMKLTLISAIFATALGGSAALADMVATVDSAKGAVLAGADNGLTLYTFRKDTAGSSTCYDACAGNWPPFLAAEEDEDKTEDDLTVIARTDGTYQWAKNGMPLYFFAGDAAKGDVNGDGMKGVWDAARPN